MSGLAVVDDTSFTVELSQPFSQFPLMLGYTAFYPVPEECIADWEPCNEAPIGNGPFKIEGTWEHDQGITVVRNDDFAGETKPAIDGVEFRIYSDPATGYQRSMDAKCPTDGEEVTIRRVVRGSGGAITEVAMRCTRCGHEFTPAAASLYLH